MTDEPHTSPLPPGALLTDADVAARLRISVRMLRDLIWKFPYYRMVGRRRRYTEDDYQRIVDALPVPQPRQALRVIRRNRWHSRSNHFPPSATVREALALASQPKRK